MQVSLEFAAINPSKVGWSRSRSGLGLVMDVWSRVGLGLRSGLRLRSSLRLGSGFKVKARIG